MRCKTETKRQSIVDVATVVFDEHGFNGASMSEIAARVGGSKATLYSYFSSKEELFMAVVLHFVESHLNELFCALDANEDLPSGLRRFGERFLGVIYRDDVISNYRNIFAEAATSSIGTVFYEQGPYAGLEQVAQFMHEAMVLGKLRDAVPIIAAKHFLALLKSEGFEELSLGVRRGLEAQEIAAMVERAVSVFLRAYAPAS